MTWFLVDTERKYDILCPAYTPSLRRSGACSLNISGRKEHRIDCALFIYSFIDVSIMFAFFSVWLRRIVLFLFSIYTWDSNILITAGLTSSFFETIFIYSLPLRVDTPGHLVKWIDSCKFFLSLYSTCWLFLFVCLFVLFLSPLFGVLSHSVPLHLLVIMLLY